MVKSSAEAFDNSVGTSREGCSCVVANCPKMIEKKLSSKEPLLPSDFVRLVVEGARGAGDVGGTKENKSCIAVTLF